MTSDKEKIARQQQVDRQTGVRRSCWSKICIERESFAFSAGSNFNCNVHQYSLNGNVSAESFPFVPEIFFVKDCIEEITRFVAAVK